VAYWKRQLAGAPMRLELPADRPRPTVQTLRGTRLFFTLPAELAAGVEALGRQAGTTSFMTLLAAFKVLLYALTDQEDILVGSPFANRPRAETESVIGAFVNTVVLRTRVSGDARFYELLGRARETVLGASAHQELPFEKVVEAVRPPRDPSRNPLFQVNFRVAPAPPPPLRLAGLSTSPLQIIDSANSKFDLALEVTVDEPGLRAFFEYSTDLFNEATIKRMAEDFERLLVEILARPDCALRELDIVRDIRARLTKGAGDAPTRTPRAAKGLRDIRRKAVGLPEPVRSTAETQSGESSGGRNAPPGGETELTRGRVKESNE